MNSQKKLYEDQYFYITKCKEFPNVPGLLIIHEKDANWYSSEESIKRLALIVKTIRDELMKLGFELTGIYGEENNNEFKILIIPYNVKLLIQNNIPPDLYQPFIQKYLESFKQKDNCSDIVNTKILSKLKKRCDY